MAHPDWMTMASDGAALDDQQQPPAVHEPGERMVGIAQVGVVAAGLGAQRAELGKGQRAAQRYHAAGDPRRQHQRAGTEPLGNDVGIDEDAGADDAADHDHGGIERPEGAFEGHTGAHPIIRPLGNPGSS